MFLLVCVVSLLSFTIVACGGGSGGGGGKTTTVTVTLDRQTLSITTYETPTLIATVEGASGEYEVVWTSSDSTVATVANGKITPLKAGSTVIRASVLGKYAEATLTVTVPVFTPEAHVDYVSLNVYMGRDKQLEAYATYNGIEVEGATFTFTPEDATVVSISSRGVAQGLKKGSTTVTVTGTLQGDALTPCEFELNVFENLELDAGIALGTTIYRGEGRGNLAPFTTTYTVNPAVTLNGRTLGSDMNDKVSFELSTDDTDLVELNGLDIVGKSAGQAIVRLTATTVDGTSDFEEFIIIIDKPYSTINPASEIVLETKPGGATANLSYLDLTDDIDRIEVNAVRTTSFDYDAGSGTFAATAGIPYGKDATVKLETETEIVFTKMTITAVDIKTKADMKYFVDNVPVWSDNNEKPIVTMSADIDYGGDLYDPGYLKYFYGTFDGQGHVFRNAVFRNGFLSRMGLGSTVKNVAIVDITLQANCDVPAFVRDIWGTVSDVYFSCDLSNLIGGISKVTNIPLTYSIETRTPDRAGTLKNVVAVFTNNNRTEKPVIARYIEGPLENVYVRINPNSFNNEKFNGMCEYLQAKGSVSNVGVYTSDDAFDAATTASSSFDTSGSGVWAIKNGKLVFKTMEG